MINTLILNQKKPMFESGSDHYLKKYNLLVCWLIYLLYILYIFLIIKNKYLNIYWIYIEYMLNICYKFIVS